jgi:hypothetical protein
VYEFIGLSRMSMCCIVVSIVLTSTPCFSSTPAITSCFESIRATISLRCSSAVEQFENTSIRRGSIILFKLHPSCSAFSHKLLELHGGIVAKAGSASTKCIALLVLNLQAYNTPMGVICWSPRSDSLAGVLILLPFTRACVKARQSIRLISDKGIL